MPNPNYESPKNSNSNIYNTNNISYSYIGTDYNTPTLKVIPGTGVGVSGSLNVGTTSNTSTSFNGCKLNFNSTTKCLEFTF